MDSVSIILWVEGVLFLLYYIACTILLVYFRSSPILYFRNPQLLILHDLVSAFQAFTHLINLLQGNISCDLERAKVSFVGPLISIINLCRTTQIAARFYAAVEREATFNRQEVARSASTSRPTSQLNTPGLVNYEDENLPEATHYFTESHTSSSRQPSQNAMISKDFETVEQQKKKSFYSNIALSSKRSLEFVKQRSGMSRIKRISVALGTILSKYSQRLTNWTMLYVALVSGSLIAMAYFILEYMNTSNLDDKFLVPNYCPTFSIFAVTINSVSVFFCLIVFISVLFARDAYGIHLELIAVGMFWVIGLILSSFLRYYNIGKLFLLVWVLFAQLSLHWIVMGLPVLECWIWSKKKKALTYKSRVIQDSSTIKTERRTTEISPVSPEGFRNSIHMDWYSFEHVLKDPELLMELTRFSIREFSVENILFYRRMRLLRLMTSNSVTNYANEHRLAVLREVRSIYREFFGYNAPNELNVSDHVKQEIRMAIEQGGEETLLEATLYDQAEAEILRLVFNHTFPRFLQTRRSQNFESTNV